MREGDLLHDAGVVDQKFGGEIVRAVHDEVVVPDDLPDVAGVQIVLIDPDLDVGVDGQHLLPGRFHLGPVEVPGVMGDLPLEVRDIDGVAINDADGPDSRRGQIEGNRAAQAAGPDNQHPGFEYFFLSFNPDILQEDMAAVPFKLFRGEINHGC